MKQVRRTQADKEQALNDLFDALLHLNTRTEVANFMQDLCTPQELTAVAERWRVCRLLANTDLSYRDIHTITGASLVTIGRVARFLRTEPFQGYKIMLDKMKETSDAI